MEIETLKQGQIAPYKDSIYQYKITSDLPSEEVEKHCTENIMKCSIKGGGSFNGCCNFPHGLNSFYDFKNNGDGTYIYTVCRPYCG